MVVFRRGGCVFGERMMACEFLVSSYPFYLCCRSTVSSFSQILLHVERNVDGLL
ncbi:hypothetical protein Hanom_Chr02g00135571 [Helianthus anomalus]